LELLSKLLLVDRKVVFVDFTADWCWNCKTNERFVLNVASTRSYFEENGIETIKADKTFDAPHIDTLLKQLSGAEAIPVYAVFRPEEPYQPIVMTGILSQAGLLESLAQAGGGNSSSSEVAALGRSAGRSE
jgi:thiol:disulfide interchange protein DsbD